MSKSLEKQQIRDFQKELRKSPVTLTINYQVVTNPVDTRGTPGEPYLNVKAIYKEKDMLSYKDNKLVNAVATKITFRIDPSYVFTKQMKNITVDWAGRKFEIDKAVPEVPLNNGTFLCTALISE